MNEGSSASDRVKCRSCDRMPLVSIALRNDGLCGVCRRDKEYRELQESRNHFLSNPPRSLEEIDELAPPGDIGNLGLRTFLLGIRPPILDPGVSSHADFEREVRRIAEKYSTDRARAVQEFTHLCEPFATQTRSGRSELRGIPRPYREMYALLCAWGTVGSDGFECYVENYPKWWDSEADRALTFFGFPQGCGILGESRKALGRSRGELPERFEEELENRFSRPIARFDEEVLGAFLERLASDLPT